MKVHKARMTARMISGVDIFPPPHGLMLKNTPVLSVLQLIILAEASPGRHDIAGPESYSILRKADALMAA